MTIIGDEMKKILKTTLLIIMAFLSSACVKDETIMTINSDKSVDLKVNIGYSIDSGNEFDINEIKDTVGFKGYSIDSYHDENFKGYTISKKFENIDDLCTKYDITVNLADIITKEFDDSKLFKVEKGFFKNTYTANFTYDFSEFYEYNPKIYIFGEESNENSVELANYLDEYINEKSYNIEIIKYNALTNMENFNLMNSVLNKLNASYQGIPLTIIGNKTFVGNSVTTKENIIKEIDNIYTNTSYQDYVNNDFVNTYELTYQVNLPNEALSNNATSVSSNKKTLIWNANYFNKNKIEYSFSIFKISSVIIIIIILFLMIAVTIVVFIIFKKYQKDKEKFITKNTNISNITPQFDDVNNQITSINDLMNK